MWRPKILARAGIHFRPVGSYLLPGPNPWRPIFGSESRKLDNAARNRRRPLSVRPDRDLPPSMWCICGRLRLAVFSDGQEIFNVPEGDVLKEKFVVVKIGLESADLGFVGFPDTPAKRLEIGG